MDDTIDLASKSNVSAHSSKYGRAPTPERLAAPRSALGEENGGSKARVSESTAKDTSAQSDFVQPSVTGTNSTIMHMNLSTEAFVKRELEKRHPSREEKKEDDFGGKKGTMASDEDWLDEMVSSIQQRKFAHVL